MSEQQSPNYAPSIAGTCGQPKVTPQPNTAPSGMLFQTHVDFYLRDQAREQEVQLIEQVIEDATARLQAFRDEDTDWALQADADDEADRSAESDREEAQVDRWLRNREEKGPPPGWLP